MQPARRLTPTNQVTFLAGAKGSSRRSQIDRFQQGCFALSVETFKDVQTGTQFHLLEGVVAKILESESGNPHLPRDSFRKA